MSEIISKEELEKLIKIKGEMRGAGIKEVAAFVLKEEGKEGLKKLEDTMEKLGYPLKFKEINIMQFYPLTLSAILEITVKRLFNYDDNKLQEMGRFNAKLGLVITFLIKYLISLDKATKEVQTMWKRYYTVGELTTTEYDKKKRYVILRLENFAVHPVYCQIFRGYFSAILEIIVKSKVNCQETKCSFRGDQYHEFLLKW